jgi:GH35 family endo-1,4-beta-xylanase
LTGEIITMKTRLLVSLPMFLIIAAGLALLVPLAAYSQVAPPSGERLRTLAGKFLVGYASHDNFWTLPDAATYEATASSEFNILTPENQLKFGAVEPQQNTFSFAAGDMHVQFAQAHGMQIHGHNLVWHSQLPSWLTSKTWTAALLTGVMNNHIDNVVGHYKGKIAIWDVVNEGLNDDGTLRASIWETTIGSQYIALAFQRAHAADPNAILVYNDFNLETVNAKSNALFNLVSGFKQQGIPINAIGLQMHLTSGGIDISSLTANMQRFAQLGLQIYITEMDVRYPTPISAANLQAQATIYQNVLNACLQQPACKGLQTWGFTDKYSWIPSTFAGQGDALEFDANYAAKPAYFALQSGLNALNNQGTPDFALSANPASLSLTRGASAAAAIMVSRSGGFTGSVSLSVSGLPAGVTASFNPPTTTTTSTLTLTSSTTAATGPATLTITGVSGTLTHSTTISLTVNSPGTGTGGVTVTPVINSNSAFFDDEGVKLSNTAPLTSLSITITVQATTGVTFSGQYNTVGGQILESHSSTSAAITYQYNLQAGQTVSPGTNYLFDAQMAANGTAHPTGGDTFTVTYTTGGQTFTQSGHF